MIMANMIANHYPNTAIQRALEFVDALDQGKSIIDAYMIAHPNAKHKTALGYAYTYKLSAPVKDATQSYYQGRLPPWASNKAGRAKMLSDITIKTINDPDTIETARKAIVDIDKILDPGPDRMQGNTINIDMRSIVVNAKQYQSLMTKPSQPTDQPPAPGQGGRTAENGSPVA